MFKFSSHLDEVRDTAKYLIEKKDNARVKQIVNVDDILSEIMERDIEEKLKKWRLKERKHDF